MRSRVPCREPACTLNVISSRSIAMKCSTVRSFLGRHVEGYEGDPERVPLLINLGLLDRRRGIADSPNTKTEFEDDETWLETRH